jgi:hypothetical protein
MAKLGRPRIEPTDEMMFDLWAIKCVTDQIHQTQKTLLELANHRRELVKDAKSRGATHRAIREHGGAYVRAGK